MALIANIHRSKDQKRMTPEDFNPMPRERRPKVQPIPAPITVLRDVFCRN